MAEGFASRPCGSRGGGRHFNLVREQCALETHRLPWAGPSTAVRDGDGGIGWTHCPSPKSRDYSSYRQPRAANTSRCAQNRLSSSGSRQAAVRNASRPPRRRERAGLHPGDTGREPCRQFRSRALELKLQARGGVASRRSWTTSGAGCGLAPSVVKALRVVGGQLRCLGAAGDPESTGVQPAGGNRGRGLGR